MKKYSFKKFWNYLWNDNSIGSWILLFVLAFIFIRLIFFPIVGVVFATSHPIVAVISSSMDHNMNPHERGYYLCGVSFNQKRDVSFDFWWRVCGEWYEENTNITKEEFSNFRLSGGFRRGDVIINIGRSSENINIGDVVIFDVGYPIPIIHRVVDKFEEEGVTYFSIKGDNNPTFDSRINESKIHEEQILGVSVLKIPYLGYFRLILSDVISSIRGN